MMKRFAYLVKVGRGAHVDLEALPAALQSGTLAGAGLDVFELEPLPPDHPLWDLENVLTTPHAAGGWRCFSRTSAATWTASHS